MTYTDNEIGIYTDGACSGNPGAGGWAFVVVEKNKNGEKEILRFSGGAADTTNNRMEMTAVLEALKKVDKEIESKKLPAAPISVYTDSSYVKQGISEWIFGWKKNGWKTASKQPVKNKDLWEAIDILSAKLNPRWFWVKGHAGNTFNEICDRLAVEAGKKFV